MPARFKRESGRPAIERTRVPGNIDLLLFVIGFGVGAGCTIALGFSFLEDHERRVVLPLTFASAAVAGVLVGWAFSSFTHFARMTDVAS
jgi:hypothetical protein